MLRKDNYLKLASLVMCAAVTGATIASPVVSVSASTDDVTTETTVDESDVDVITTDATSESAVSVVCNDSTNPIIFDGTQSLDEFVVSVLSMAGISTEDVDELRIDYVDNDNKRVCLRVGDAEIDADNDIQTLLDVCNFVSSYDDGVTLVVFDNSSEISRIALASVDDTKDNEMSVDVLQGSPDVSYLVRYDANGGSLDGDAFFLRALDEKISYIDSTATYENHTFDGWYDAKVGGNKIDENTVVKGNMRIYAHWIADTYKLSFDTQGGESIDDQTVSVDDAVTKLPTPVRDGYTFDGWFDSAKDGNAVTSLSITEDTTLYAHWTQVKSDDKTDINDKDTSDKTDKDKNTSDTDDVDRDAEIGLPQAPVSEPDNTISTTDTTSDTTTDTKLDDTSSDTKTETKDDTSTDETVSRYELTIVSSDGTNKIVKVKSTVQLSALTTELGYTTVTSYGLKTATSDEIKIDGSTTMKVISDLTEDGDVLIIGYDADGKAVGSAKVTKTGEDTYRVSLSKDTNVALSSNTDEADGKGKGEGEDTNTGKSDSTVQSVSTADTSVLSLYSGLSATMTGLFGAVAALKRRLLK